MNDCEFNLLAEPWIRVMREDCVVEEVSLTDALIRSHEFRELSGELPTQNAAVLRLLLAILHAVFERVDAEGNPAGIEDSDGALDRWAELWQLGKFPEKPLNAYLEQQRDNFWLFHPERPFWQAAKIRDNASRPQSEPIKKINGAISESGNKIRLFAERSGASKDYLSNAELARWLICMNQYDDNTLKTGLGVAWLGRFAAILAKGNTLFDTLMLNFVLLDYNGEPWDIGSASWETRWNDTEEVRKIALPHDPVAVLSAHSRYGLFEKDQGVVRRYKSAKGGICFDDITKNESMAIWKYDSKSDEYKYLRTYSGTQMWREFPTIIADAKGLSGVVNWQNLLVRVGILSHKQMLCYEIVNIQYDASQQSSVEDIYYDKLQLHANLLSELGEDYRVLITEEIARCDTIAYYLGTLANDLFFASGGDPEKKALPAPKAKEQYYYEIDIPFRRWLASLDAEDEDTDAGIDPWRQEAEQIARKMAEKMVRDAGPAAFVGKTVKVEENSEPRYYSSSTAMQWFNINMSKLKNR
ncbi:MAG: type I-E CRISPR-associated protein Cse1/CasA [Clostridiales bacterium]|nr:type I-E CRISPR-associated protein Cse1/CasA [Candidatus Apopatocola equi]